MKYGIFSDVHANPHALRKVLDDGAAQGVQTWVCCGDLTGYGYDAVTVVDLLRERNVNCVLGNHDQMGSEDVEPMQDHCSPYCQDHRHGVQLGPERRAWLRARPLVWRSPDGLFACTHIDFDRRDRANDDCAPESLRARRAFGARSEPLLFVGHTHCAVQYVQTVDGTQSARPAQTFDLVPGERYLVDVGTVGCPRIEEGAERAVYSSYCLVDTEARKVTPRLIDFDFEAYAVSLVTHGIQLPDWLKRRAQSFRPQLCDNSKM